MMDPLSGRLLVLGVLVILGAALTAVLARLFREYQSGTLTARTILIGGFMFSGIFGLALACLQTLLDGPAL